jgi:hypothetical protein
MKHALLATALLTALVSLTGVLSARSPNDTSIPSAGQTPDLSGTYIRSLHPRTCSVIGGPSISPALYIAQSQSTMTLRVFSTRSVRMLQIERRESAIQHLAQRNGLARWKDDELIIETMAPAFPLWDEGPYAVAAGSKLTESFVPVPGDRLIYRTWYTPPGGGKISGPSEVPLAKCRSHR